MEIDLQKLWYVSRYCGRKFSKKSAAYVSYGVNEKHKKCKQRASYRRSKVF